MRERHSQNQNHTTHDYPASKAAFLAHHPLFCSLSTNELADLDRATSTITCPAGHVFYRPGESGNALFLLSDGQVQLYHLSTDGRKLITALLESGACFGELLLLGQITYNCFAEASTDSRVYSISKHEVEHLLMQHSSLALALLKHAGQHIVQVEAKLIDTAFKSVTARLAGLLLQLAQPQETVHNTLVINGLTHESLAERLGIYRETVSASLRELKDAGAIDVGRKHITINDIYRLQSLAAP